MHRTYIILWMASVTSSYANSSDVTIVHASGMFVDDPSQIRVEVPVPIEENVTARVDVQVTPAKDASTECSDFHTPCAEPGTSGYLDCSCDTDCDVYGNCCFDAPISKPRRQIYGCPRLTEERVGRYMIDGCAVDWTNDKIRTLCETSNTSHDPFLMVPVSYKEATFKNYYCAVCNRNTTDLFSWSFSIADCPKMTLANCSINTTIPENITFVPCDTTVISKCPKSDGNFSERCDLYYLPVQDKITKSEYKNKFCAYCRGVTNVECVNGPSMPKTLNMLGISGAAKTASYSILIDIDFTRGGSVVGSIEKCHQPDQDICRRISCEDNDCVLDITVTNSSDPLSSKCTEWLVDGLKYNLEKNGTLILFNESSEAKKPVCVRDYSFGTDQDMLTRVCISLSLICLTLKIVLHFFTKNRKKLSQKAIFLLSCSLFVAQFLFLVGSDKTKWGVFCQIIGILMHYSFLASFVWTNILTFDIWRTFSSFRATATFNASKRFIHYNLYAWLFPLFVVSLAIVFQWGLNYDDLRPDYGLEFCWISRKLPLLVFLAAPLAGLLGINLFFFFSTVAEISNSIRASRDARENVKQDQVRFVLYFKLAFIMGLTWTFGFVAAFVGSDLLWCLFTVFNGLQGVFLLLAFTRLNVKEYLLKLRRFVSKATLGTPSCAKSSARETSTTEM